MKQLIANFIDEQWTNARALWTGWRIWAVDMQYNWDKFKQNPKRPLHFLHACVTTTIEKPYRTWGLLFWVLLLCWAFN